MELREIVKLIIQILKKYNESRDALVDARQIYDEMNCQILSQSGSEFEFMFTEGDKPNFLKLTINQEELNQIKSDTTINWNKYQCAAILQLYSELNTLNVKKQYKDKKYTRDGMIKRVLDERRERARKADYNIKWANNIYGDHILTNENGSTYKLFLRDFENEIGYSDSMDSKTNKLGTTKHIMFAFNYLKNNVEVKKSMSKICPFIEIYLDPLNEYKISWFYPHGLTFEESDFLNNYFGTNNSFESDDLSSFVDFVINSKDYERIKIRPEVIEKIDNFFDNQLLENIKKTHKIDFSEINAELYPYQKEGVEFTVFKKSAIIADEMGLGKTIQAISTAVIKRKIFEFKRTLVICPASLKHQWKNEIEKFSNLKAEVVGGKPHEREEVYNNSEAYFLIVNYETVLRDKNAINKAGIDFLILDEAQKIKNYISKTANTIKQINKKHALIITGTPIENKLIDIFSIIGALDPYFLGPLWEFSYQHCLFDNEKKDKINGYYDLNKLKERIAPILIRREKRKVLDQLPNVQQKNITVHLHPEQSSYHDSYAKGIAKIIHKKFLTPYDMQRLQILLANMRMVCNSTFLIDNETNFSPKLAELKSLLLNDIDIKNSNRKIIIFSEWVKMHKLIGKELRDMNVGFVELNGKIPVKNRGELIKRFEENDNCKVFLSTEAGGAGLNLQVADTVINFELPWNPAKKNQRIGRIDRLGQKNNKLTVINFITDNSIEVRIATGLVLKQNLFEGVLNEGNNQNYVDFSTDGRPQFLSQIEEMLHGLESDTLEDTFEDYEDEKVVDSNEEVKDFGVDNQISSMETEVDKKSQAVKSQENISSGKSEKAKEMEDVMNMGMSFLAGMYKMSTGKDLNSENQKIEIDEKTGEVTMKFKLPGF